MSCMWFQHGFLWDYDAKMLSAWPFEIRVTNHRCINSQKNLTLLSKCFGTNNNYYDNDCLSSDSFLALLLIIIKAWIGQCTVGNWCHQLYTGAILYYEPPRDKMNKVACLIRVFAVRMKKAWVLSYPLSAQQRLWSDWADAQADLSLRWAHMPLCWFCHKAAFIIRGLLFLVWHIPEVFIFWCGKQPWSHFSKIL